MRNEAADLSGIDLNLTQNIIYMRAWKFGQGKEKNDFKTKIRPLFEFSGNDSWETSRCMTTARPFLSLCKGKEDSKRTYV
jgi:hypothetical protein